MTDKTTDELRAIYLEMAPYKYDTNVSQHFTDQELKKIKAYGYWFSAIWSDKIPLKTDKLKHFYLSKNELCDDRNQMEQLWYKYTLLTVPF